MYETLVTVSGNLVSDVTYRVTGRGDPVASFRVACSVKRPERDSGRWVDAGTTYFTVTAWRRAAENARASLAKGHPVVVHGRVRQRVVDRPVPDAPGVTVPITYTDVEALSFGLDLSRCRAQYARSPSGPQTSDAGPWTAGVSTGPAPDGGRAGDAA